MWIVTFVSAFTFPNPISSIRVSTKGSKPRRLLHVKLKASLLFSNTLQREFQFNHKIQPKCIHSSLSVVLSDIFMIEFPNR